MFLPFCLVVVRLQLEYRIQLWTPLYEKYIDSAADPAEDHQGDKGVGAHEVRQEAE